MAQIFAPHDIAVIAGAFRPDVPSKQKPSLVWNAAGDQLLQSRKVQERFEQLLIDGKNEIPVDTLSKALGTKQVDWCISAREEPLVYSTDREAILTRPQVDKLLAGILEAAQKQYTELESFLVSHEADRDSFRERLDRSAELEVFPEYHGKSSRTWLVSKELHAKTAINIEELLRGSSGDHKTDLSVSLPGVPRSIVLDLAEQLAQRHGIKGTVRSGKTRITFLSAAYEDMLKDQKAKKVANEFSKILVHTHRHGWHVVPENSDDSPGLRDVFFERTQAGLADGSFSMINNGDQPIALAFTNQLEIVLSELKANACDFIVDSWKAKNGMPSTSSLDSGHIEQLLERSSNEEFAKLLLQDPKYRAAIEQSVQTKLDDIESNDLQQSNEAFNEYVRLPIRLYLTGLNEVKDASLRQRLEDYVLEFLSKDLVPTGIQHSEDEKHRNRSLIKELEKFGQSCLEAKSLYELQNSLSRFARKQKLEHVTMEDEFEVKMRILNQKLKAMKRMIRGSDILQNLIWILLAYEHHGLFISSGRDTTRMIRFYQSSGDEEIGLKLETWKDRFKAGQESREDFEEMRALAERTVQQIDAVDDGVEPELEINGEQNCVVNGTSNGQVEHLNETVQTE